MILTKQQLVEMEKAAKPLNAFLRKYCHPHCRIIVDGIRTELMEGVATCVEPYCPTKKESKRESK